MSRLRPATWALLVYLSLALAVLGPSLLDLQSAAIGSTGADAHKHIWSQWWVWSQLQSGQGIPLETQLIFFPDGGSFYSLDTANALLSFPLRFFLSPLVVYNLLYLFHLVAAAWACWWLARELDLSEESSLIAGTAGIFSAWVLAFPMGSGVSETMAIFPLPLCWLFGIRMLRQPGWSGPVGCATSLLLQAAFCWSYAIIASVGLFVLGISWLAHRPWQKGPGRAWLLDRAVCQRIGLSIFLVALIVLPLYLGIQGTVSTEDAIYSRNLSIWPHAQTPNPLSLPETNHTPLADFFLPGSLGLRVSNEGVERLLYAAYPGWLTLLACGLALRQRGRTRLYLGIGLVLFFALALGPIIDLDHERTGPHLANPIHLAFFYAFPLFNATIHSTDRILVGLQILLGLGAGLGLAPLLSRIRPERRRWASMSVALLVVLELIWISPAPWPVPTTQAAPHPVSLRLAKQTGTGAVLDIPFYTSEGRFHGDIFYQQTIHGRPLPFRLDGMKEQVVSNSLRKNPFYRELEHDLLETPWTTGSTCEDARALAELGFDAIILRTDRLDAAMSTRLITRMESCLGELEIVDEARIAWLDGTR